MAERAGFEFRIRPEDQAAWYEASRIGFELAKTEPMAELILARIQHFFEHYKDLEKGKWVKVTGWADAEAARAEISSGVERLAAK